jgi:hypothetical protein
MVGGPLLFSDHAEDMLIERRIERDWVEQTIFSPEIVEQDAKREGITLAFRRIPERENRVLRVAYVESADEIRVVTTYFDRGRRRKMQGGS